MLHTSEKVAVRILESLAAVLIILALTAGGSIFCFGGDGKTDRDAVGNWDPAGDMGPQSDLTKVNTRTERVKYAAAQSEGSKSGRSPDSTGKGTSSEKVWKSQELDLLAIGMGVGDVDGDGKNEIVIIDPSSVYLYRMTPDHTLSQVCEYSSQSLELKSVDVTQSSKQGPCRIYVSAQNRGMVTSFVLEYKGGKLVPVATGIPYFLRVIDYPTQGPFLLGQRKGLARMYDGPIFRMLDKGDDLEPQGRFGVPLKIPIFGFAIGDFEGKQKPLIAVYDRDDHLRVYDPTGKKLYMSPDFYGGSDVVLRSGGPEKRENYRSGLDEEKEFFRPRILSKDLGRKGQYEVLAVAHSSKTRRILSHTKMLEDGRIVCMAWNGDALTETWGTPKIQGMVVDFAIDTLPGFSGQRLITMERKKTDWLAFLRSKSQLRVYDLQYLINEGPQKGSAED